MTDLAVQLLIIEGIPSLVLVYYLYHKKHMYMLEKGISPKNDAKVRSERRIINGLFLTLAGVFMIAAPSIANVMGIEAQLNFELLLTSLVVLGAGLSMLIAGEILKLKSGRQYEPDNLAK